MQVTGEEAAGFVRDVGADKVEFKFKKPKSIAIGGSYSIKCVVKPDVSVDLFIQLPKVPGFLAINPRCCWLH
jgi:U3 small nucleolar RNA-associated protein 22